MSKKKLYDFGEVSVILLTPIPVDVTEGLSLDASFISTKRNGSLVKAIVGLNGEVIFSDSYSMLHTLTLVFLPNSKNVMAMDILVGMKWPFGIKIQNKSAPKYIGLASNCRIESDASIDAKKNGLSDHQYTILMADYIGAHHK